MLFDIRSLIELLLSSLAVTTGLACTLFSGAAIYISFVEHPARLSCGTEVAAKQWAPSYKRATVVQVSLAILATLGGISLWLLGAGSIWLWGSVCIFAVMPFTVIVIFPTNKKLLEPGRDLRSEETRALLEVWGRLHGVRSILSLFASLLFLLALRGSAQTTREAMAVLEAAARRYSGLRSYHFVSTTEITSADGSQSKTLGQVLAGAPEGKTRHEMDTPIGGVVAVSDGTTEWTYLPTTNEYVVSAPGSGPFTKLNQEFIRSYAMVDSHLVRAKWIRAEDLRLGGKPVTCDVIRVDEQPGRPAVEDPEADRLWRAEWMGVPKTYWIDREKHRILRVATTSTKGARQETRYSVARVDEDLPAALFASPVPPGATKVDAPREGRASLTKGAEPHSR